MIVLEKIGLRYGDGPHILRDIDLTLAAGSFHFITGASGAGKTSLLKLIFLAHHASAGRLHLFNKDVTQLTRKQAANMRRKIGVIFQDFRLLDHLSVYENVALPLRIDGQRQTDYRANVLELLEWVGLDAQAHALPPTLSGGEKQRAAIARAVITAPDIIIADEPTGNVDAQMGLRIVQLLDALHKGGATILMATHDETIQNHFNHPRLYLEKGRITQKGGVSRKAEGATL
ncbi:MAG: ATP-binding cassette domain-containing protein [Alphaproteobacteria bacterium]|nr:ATP-binding cassette domain-containing protein [Alphaproteobacteria bacterium]